jgi:hypothetical protein
LQQQQNDDESSMHTKAIAKLSKRSLPHLYDSEE